MFPPLKVKLAAHVLERGMKEFDDVSHELGTLSIDFSKLTMAEVYVVHHAVVTEIRFRESALVYHAHKETRKAQKCKALLR